VNKVFQDYLKVKGIRCQTTVPYTPEQNGFSAVDASEVKLSNRFIVLEKDTLEAVWQNQGFLKQKIIQGRSLAGNLKSKKRKIFLESSNGRVIGPMLQETLGCKFEVCSIFNPNAPLAKVSEDLGKLDKGLTK
jgi:hypothetical protein